MGLVDVVVEVAFGGAVVVFEVEGKEVDELTCDSDFLPTGISALAGIAPRAPLLLSGVCGSDAEDDHAADDSGGNELQFIA